jgi:hypothetical protein
MENYQIALSPDLGLSPADFVTAWNEEAEARNLAEAHLVPSTSEHYDPTLVGQLANSLPRAGERR